MRRQTKKKNEDGWDTSSFGVLQRLKEEMEEQDRAARARQKATVPDRPALKSDEELFREAMGGVREIPEFTAIPFPQRQPNPEPCRRSMDDDVAILRQIVRGERKIRLSDTGEYIEWNSPLLAGDLADRLHRESSRCRTA